MQRVTSKELDEKIIEDYKNGMSINEISEKYGCCKSTLGKRLKGERNRIKKISATKKVQICSKIASGMTIKAVAEEYGVSVSTIFKIKRDINPKKLVPDDRDKLHKVDHRNDVAIIPYYDKQTKKMYADVTKAICNSSEVVV